ncbi:helix-turn-helix domain-containing protein [Streptomyces sp. ZSW22]|uniref:helix-turn-helix transcriptional regulator n=1 Tax=Streptomyces sp. ZSW22 TaxID=3055050 RepID=UPI0025AF3B78|nr:helix-turn-helix domain-containing protein [Streptomyces sp. ZSW22]MDN3244132.1 helix-turn-helix domain-containing protein [Streptomyces sp. ZSW22]
MPNNPEREGSPRLITITEIAAEYGVSRATVHNYRRAGTFPRPAPVEGTEKTKLRFRADEVAAWFAANPKRQGKRTDLATNRQSGAAPVIEGQMGTQALNGNDARAILGIVWKWIADANDGLGSDVGDLQHDLESAGYGPVEEAQDG